MRAAIYMRKSQDDPNSYSFEYQEKDGRAYADTKGYVVVAALKEPGLTGHDSLEDRPALSRARAMLRRGEADVLVVWLYDRLARDFLDQAFIIREAKMHGARVESIHEPVPEGPLGWILQAVHGGMAEEDWHKTKMRLESGRRRRVERGFYLAGSKAPYGYIHTDGEKKKAALAPDPETAPVVIIIFEWAADGISANEIAKRLTAQGIPSPKGKPQWHENVVSKLLKRRLYLGEATSFATEKQLQFATDQASGEIRRKWVRVKVSGMPLPAGTVPALVDEDVFNRAQASIQRNHTHSLSGRVIEPERYLLRGGFARCEVCGQSLGVRTSSRGAAPLYQCHAKRTTAGVLREMPEHGTAILTGALDTFVWTRFVEAVSKPNIIARAVELLDGRRDEAVAAQLAVWRNLLDENQAEQDALAGTIRQARTELAQARLARDMDALALAAEGYQARIGALERQDAVFLAAKEMLARFRSLSAVDLGALDYHAKRRLLFDFGVRVYVGSAHKKKGLPEDTRCTLKIWVLDGDEAGRVPETAANTYIETARQGQHDESSFYLSKYDQPVTIEPPTN